MERRSFQPKALPSPPQASPPTFGLALDFMRVLWALDHALQSISKAMNVQFGITGPQRLVVRIIGKLPGLSGRDLARALHVHPSTLTGVIRRLEDRRLIERRISQEDARRAQFYLTPKGQRVNRSQLGTVEAYVRSTLVRLNPRDVDTARKVLQAVTRKLEQVPGMNKNRAINGASNPLEWRQELLSIRNGHRPRP